VKEFENGQGKVTENVFFGTYCRNRVAKKQEAQLMLTNLHGAFGGQSRSPNSTIPYVRYSFLLWNIAQ